MFEKFKENIKNYNPLSIKLLKGASEEMIHNTESELELKFPPVYRLYLSRWNGGKLFNTYIFSLNDPSLDITEQNVYQLLKVHTSVLRESLPESYLIIAIRPDQNMVCLDLETAIGEGCELVLYDRNQSKILKRWGNMELWLEYELELIRQTWNFDGTLKF